MPNLLTLTNKTCHMFNILFFTLALKITTFRAIPNTLMTASTHFFFFQERMCVHCELEDAYSFADKEYYNHADGPLFPFISNFEPQVNGKFVIYKYGGVEALRAVSPYFSLLEVRMCGRCHE